MANKTKQPFLPFPEDIDWKQCAYNPFQHIPTVLGLRRSNILQAKTHSGLAQEITAPNSPEPPSPSFTNLSVQHHLSSKPCKFSGTTIHQSRGHMQPETAAQGHKFFKIIKIEYGQHTESKVFICLFFCFSCLLFCWHLA
ncbi:hypothetical protein ATANTOWER_032964 [Ataeniobius toweri]|uniref:Uncharacterized protein n=1 Tax=Ataeniobius toweri TaxID=208326 RepID=A0ABU7BWE8_9TELE|nr:hypothetical protein [Ataeniobius toweri]